MEAGKMTQFTVERETDIGYILSDGHKENEIFLHYNDCDGRNLQDGEVVDAFLYFDHKNRIAATLQKPKITVFDCDWVEVVDVVYFGVYVNIGIRKDILLSSDDLPLDANLWPQIGDLLYANLYNDNDKGLLLELASKDDFLEIKVNAPSEIYGNKIQARVFNLGKHGVNVITNEGYLGFIHHSEYKEEPRLGGLVEGRIINVKANGEINLSLIPQKEIAINDDTELIMDYLNSNSGNMPLGDASSPDEIKSLLGISKSAFKRAMGKLIKDNKIIQNQEKKITSLK
ncbi:hypothetical protein KHQ81_02470 [Mycoplasmatota bacterium]|nr:hypothetical protein KHQ81_02470 [Mycoplasmatota bacterium]